MAVAASGDKNGVHLADSVVRATLKEERSIVLSEMCLDALGPGDLPVSLIMEVSRYIQTGDRKPLEDLLATIPDSEKSPWNLTT